MVNFRMDESLKKNVEKICSELGISLSTAFTIFAKRMEREHGIPFDMQVDSFYSEPNLAHIRRGVAQLDAGKGVMHDIIEVDDDEQDLV